MEIYEKPMINIVCINVEDIITTSSEQKMSQSMKDALVDTGYNESNTRIFLW